MVLATWAGHLLPHHCAVTRSPWPRQSHGTETHAASNREELPLCLPLRGHLQEGQHGP